MAIADEDIKRYIAFRYPNWMDYARHMAQVNHFEGWEEDLLNDIILDLMQKPEENIKAMFSRTTEKMVNGKPTTELDKFILRMLHLNACSPLAPFRKNTLGRKIIERTGNKVEVQHSVELNGYDMELDDYDTQHASKLDMMHFRNIRRMKMSGFRDESIALYDAYFMRGEKPEKGQETALAKIINFLIR